VKSLRVVDVPCSQEAALERVTKEEKKDKNARVIVVPRFLDKE